MYRTFTISEQDKATFTPVAILLKSLEINLCLHLHHFPMITNPPDTCTQCIYYINSYYNIHNIFLSPAIYCKGEKIGPGKTFYCWCFGRSPPPQALFNSWKCFIFYYKSNYQGFHCSAFFNRCKCFLFIKQEGSLKKTDDL